MAFNPLFHGRVCRADPDRGFTWNSLWGSGATVFFFVTLVSSVHPRLLSYVFISPFSGSPKRGTGYIYSRVTISTTRSIVDKTDMGWAIPIPILPAQNWGLCLSPFERRMTDCIAI